MSALVCQYRHNQMDWFFFRSSWISFWISFWIQSLLWSWWETFMFLLPAQAVAIQEQGDPLKNISSVSLSWLWKRERSLTFVAQGQCYFFFTDSGFIVCPFWEIKNFSGARVRKFFRRENSTAKRLIFGRFISTNTFNNLVKSYMFPSKRYYFFISEKAG